MLKNTKSCKKPKLKIVRPSHDAILRKSLENPALAKMFFDLNLPAYVKSVIDTSNLIMEKESFVDDNLKHSIGDILFSMKCGESEAYIYLLLEHQSKPDPLMSFRLVKYMMNIWGRHLTQNPNSTILPLIYPMVFYNGKQKYNVPQNLCDLFDDKILGRRFWHEDHHLINVNEISDEDLTQGSAVGMLEYFMKHIRARDLIKRWEEMAPLLNDAKVIVGKDFIRILAHYTLTSLDEDGKIKLDGILVENLSKEDGEDIMGSYAENLMLKGIEQGIEQEKYSVVLNMLRKHLDLSLISDVTGASIEMITNIARDKNLNYNA